MRTPERPDAPPPHPDRYARQTALAVIGAEGQRRLGRATVLIVGCGALGSLQAEWTARAGIGHLILVDRDILELHNLQRQVLYTERDVSERLPKAVAAARHLREINSEVLVESEVEDITTANIIDFVRRADVILDGTDNAETRYLINDAAIREGRPWIYGGVLGTEGLVLAVLPRQGPCLRCLFEEPPSDPGTTCEIQGVLATAAGWVAALQVTQMLALLAGSTPLEPRLHSVDIWTGRTVSARANRNSGCVCCGRHHFEFLDAKRGTAAVSVCSRNAVQLTPFQSRDIDLSNLAGILRSSGRVTLNGFLLECELGLHKLVIFADGRVLVMGTTDPAEARNLVAKYLGF